MFWDSLFDLDTKDVPTTMTIISLPNRKSIFFTVFNCLVTMTIRTNQGR
jgi:hypothetical protein